MIKIYEPFKIQESAKYVKECVLNSKLTFQNEEYRLAKKRLQDLHKKKVIPVFNGTCATHLTYKCLKKRVPNLKTILVPNNVYVAAWNSMLFDGDDINLIPIDADNYTWCVDTKLLSKELSHRDPETTGVLIVHNVGNVVNVPKIMREYPNFQVIEDNCEGFLGKYEGHLTGTKSLASSISFYANKTITCSEGGAVIIDNLEDYEILNSIHSQGQTKQRYVHDILAYNYRMTNIQAAILLSQLELLQEIKDKKRKIVEKYKTELDNKYIFQQIEKDTEHSNWMFSVRIEGFNYHREFDQNMGFETRPMFYPMSKHEHLKKYSFDRSEAVANLLSKECFMLPSHPSLTEQDTDLIISKLNGFING